MIASRRAFIRGQWSAAEEQASSACHAEIVSLIISTWPQYLDEVEEAILTLGNCEVHGRDPSGKLIVVLEEASSGAAGAKANAISALPHVLSALMVFQASDDGLVVV